MKDMVSIIFAVIAGVGVLSGCASVPSQAGFGDVQTLVDTRVGARLHWNQGLPEDLVAAYSLESMLREKLSADRAVEIALFNNRSLQATFENLGIAQADLVQAGLLENPVFASSVRFPDRNGEATNVEFSVAQNFINILFLPLRKKLAKEQFEETKLRVGNTVLQLTADVRIAYYQLQGTHEMHVMWQQIIKAAEAARELAERQHEVGNINTLDLNSKRVAFHEFNLELKQSDAKLKAEREHLNLLMGLTSEHANWGILKALPELPANEWSLDGLLALAESQRLDLAAQRQKLEVLEHALKIARFGVIPPIAVGVNTEREPDRTQLTGPTFELEVPLFDHGQGSIRRAKAQLRKSQNELAALQHQVESEVRLVYHQLLAERRTVEYYRDTIVPLHEKSVALFQKEYNYMLHGVYTLLEAKQDEIMARRDGIENLRDYWIVRSELERAVGGRLTWDDPSTQPMVQDQLETETPTMDSQESPETSHDHQHGDK